MTAVYCIKYGKERAEGMKCILMLFESTLLFLSGQSLFSFLAGFLRCHLSLRELCRGGVTCITIC